MIVSWFAGLAIVASVLMWWFNTALLVHILEIFRAVGIKRKNAEFWSVPLYGSSSLRNDLAYFTKNDVDAWMQTHFHPKMAELLSCPGCLSAHVSFWTAAALQPFLSEYSIPFFVVCWLGWPGLANVLLAQSRSVSPVVPQKAIEPRKSPAPESEESRVEPKTTKPQEHSPEDIERINEERKAKMKKDYHALLTARGIKFHEKPDGTIQIDYTPRRELVVGKFLSNDDCPEEVPDCVALREQYNQELESKGGASCTACEKNKIKEKYRNVVLNIIKDMPNMD